MMFDQEFELMLLPEQWLELTSMLLAQDQAMVIRADQEDLYRPLF